MAANSMNHLSGCEPFEPDPRSQQGRLYRFPAQTSLGS
jgi:hypothetical protein